MGLVLGGGGGVSCGAPPGCELGALAGGAVWSDGAVVAFGLSAEPPPFELCEQAPTERENAATHSNNRLRFIGLPLKGSFQTKAQCRKRRSTCGQARQSAGPGP